MQKIANILRDTSYKLTLFDPESIAKLEKSIITRDGKYYANCLIRDKEIQLKPEEVVRQLFVNKLINDYGYPKHRIKLEVDIRFGREIGVKRADIVVYREDLQKEYILVEVKKPSVKDGLDQLKAYSHATGSPLLILTDGIMQYNLYRTEPNNFEDLANIPRIDETIEDIRKKIVTFQDLVHPNDLKKLIQDLENTVLARAGVNAFDEIFKLIYAKLFDEIKTPRKENRRFRVIAGATDKQNLDNLKRLFEDAKNEWADIFKPKDELDIPENAIAPAVSLLMKYRLFGTNLSIIDEAFEYLIQQDSKGEKGQYFTPRHVIDMCVKMLNPNHRETIIDSASGSCGFLLHAMRYVWDHQLNEDYYGYDFKVERKDYANTKLYGIDYDPRAVKIGKALMLIAGDGKTNINFANSLESDLWDEDVRSKMRALLAHFNEFEQEKDNQDNFREFNFDIVLTNPPFAGDVHGAVLSKFDLGYKSDRDGRKLNKVQNKMSRDVLFIERNLNFLKPGGRMAIVLPQGRFNNTSDKSIREYIAQRARILAVVGLHVNTFKPHTGTKTSVLFVQKWNNNAQAGPLCPKVDDYPIFFAVSEKSGKNNSGEYVYLKNSSVSGLSTSPSPAKLDKNGHLIIDHDLHNHDGELPDGVAEKFIEWAKIEKLSFWSM